MQQKYTAAFCTLGCKVNQYETARMSELLENSGFELVSFNKKADLYIINTCTVTATADSKSRHAIHRAFSLNPDAKILVAGCIADYSPEDAQNLPGVTRVLKDKEESHLVDLLSEMGFQIDSSCHTKKVIEGGINFRTRAVLKIQDGCDQFCSYCVIPHVRGGIRSSNLAQVAEEASKLAESGYKEIVLTGIRLGTFGLDRGKRDLASAVRVIAEIPVVERIRLSSIEPTDLDEELLDLMASSSKVCAHLHLPLQSGDDTILKAMNRPYDSAKYRSIMDHICTKMPDIAITTDVLVGFPGETEENFENTYRMAEYVKYARMHVFKYSPRPGTPAAEMDSQVDPSVKDSRSKRLIELSEKLSMDFRNRFIGQTHRILVEGKEKEGLLNGLTDQYIRVCFEGSPSLKGRIVKVQLLKIKEDFVLGKLVEPEI